MRRTDFAASGSAGGILVLQALRSVALSGLLPPAIPPAAVISADLPRPLRMSKAGVVAALMGLYGASSTRWSGCTTTSMMANENAERSATRRRREATALTLTLLWIFSIGFWDLATYGEEPYMGS